jgi:hypothetical protein
VLPECASVFGGKVSQGKSYGLTLSQHAKIPHINGRSSVAHEDERKGIKQELLYKAVVLQL